MAPQKRHRRTNTTAARKGGKVRKHRYPKTVRGKRHSTAGKIFPILHVTSPRQLPQIPKYLNQGPMAIVIIVADWCGHCQTLKPHIEAAANLPERNVQLITVRDDMLSGYNKTVNRFNRSASPIEVDGFPSMIAVTKDGNKITEFAPTAEALNSAVTKVVPVAAEAGLVEESLRSGNSLIANTHSPVKPRSGSPEMIASKMVETQVISPTEKYNSKPLSFEHINDTIVSKEPMGDGIKVQSLTDVGVSPTFSYTNPRRPSNGIITEIVPPNAVSKKSTNGLSSGLPESEAKIITSFEEVPTSSESTSPTSKPVSPSVISDLRKPKTGGTIIGGGKRGGSLYGIMSQTAYRLAPTAVLLATAAAVMKKKTRSNKSARGRTQKQRRYRK